MGWKKRGYKGETMKCKKCGKDMVDTRDNRWYCEVCDKVYVCKKTKRFK